MISLNQQYADEMQATASLLTLGLIGAPPSPVTEAACACVLAGTIYSRNKDHVTPLDHSVVVTAVYRAVEAVYEALGMELPDDVLKMFEFTPKGA